jgi:hypothetical protein
MMRLVMLRVSTSEEEEARASSSMAVETSILTCVTREGLYKE